MRIIVGVNFFDYVARRLLCLAYREKMTMEHGYQWFLPGWYPRDWWNTTKYTDDFDKYVETASVELGQTVICFARSCFDEVLLGTHMPYHK